MSKRIEKAIDINASAASVWNVLMKAEYQNKWYDEFMPGTTAQTDWQPGSKVVYADPAGNGMIGKIVVHKTAEELRVEYTGFLANGKEDYESLEAKTVKGGQENYYLQQQDDITHLTIESDMDDNYFDMASASWDKALQKIKEMAEKV